MSDYLDWGERRFALVDPNEGIELAGVGSAHELPDNGFGLLIAWAGGDERVFAVPAELSAESQLNRDQFFVDGDHESYLADAGVAAAPRGFRWFFRTPSGWSTADLQVAVAASQDGEEFDRYPHPSTTLTNLERIVAKMP